MFLSTDSGSVGLNLQVASAVINIDLTWNPAKLEQRIARAWRKNQTRSVSVVNLVAEGTIEHSILHLIGQKQALADEIIDGEGDLDALKMASGRGAFIERMQAMMETPAAPARMVSTTEEFIADLLARHGDKLSLVEARQIGEGLPRLLAVLDVGAEVLVEERKRPVSGLTVEFIDWAAWSAMLGSSRRACCISPTRRASCTAPRPCKPRRRLATIGRRTEPGRAARWRRRIGRCAWPRRSLPAASRRRRRRCSPARCVRWSRR